MSGHETSRLARFTTELTFDQLPRDVIDKAKVTLLDTIGVNIGASSTASAKPARELAEGFGPGPATILGTKSTAQPVWAALANGVAVHGLEWDDYHEVMLHSSSSIVPVALALGEATGVTGKELLASIVAGSEVTIRMAKAGVMSCDERGFHNTGITNVFGAAATACRLLCTTEEQTLYALAIAANQASGIDEFLVGHSWTKRLHPGWAAHAGIVAAMLGKKGFWGEASAIEGDLGFFHAYFNSYDLSPITDGLGEVFDPFLDTTVKYFACCGRIHTPLDAELRIMADEKLKPEDVSSVLVAMNTRDVETLGRPEEMRRNPPGRLEAQFSIPYCIAAGLVDGELTLKQFTPEAIAAPAVREAIEKVKVIADPAYDSEPDAMPGRVTINTKDGRSFTKEVVYPPGSRENPLNWDQLVQKFMSVGSRAMGERQLADIADHLATVEEWSTLTGLTELLRA